MESKNTKNSFENSNSDEKESVPEEHHDTISNVQDPNPGVKFDSLDTTKKSVSAIQSSRLLDAAKPSAVKRCKQANRHRRLSAPALISNYRITNEDKKDKENDTYMIVPKRLSGLNNEIKWTLKTKDKKSTTMQHINSYFDTKSKQNLERNDACLLRDRKFQCKGSHCIFCSINSYEAGPTDQYTLVDDIHSDDLLRVKNSIMESRFNGFPFVEKIIKVYKIACKIQTKEPDDKELVYFFHGTQAEKVISILKSGLKCKDGFSSGMGIYLTPSSTVAALHAAKRTMNQNNKISEFQYVFVNSIKDYFNKSEVVLENMIINKECDVYEKIGMLKYSLNYSDRLHLFPKQLSSSTLDITTYLGVDEILVKNNDDVSLEYLVLIQTKDPILDISKVDFSEDEQEY